MEMVYALGTKKTTLYAQSIEPTGDFFYHHSTYKGLKGITQSCSLRSGNKPWRGISLTTDIGRFGTRSANASIVKLQPQVDGFVEIPRATIEAEIVPCLYIVRGALPHVAPALEELGYKVFTEDEIPSEYKYILSFVAMNQMFSSENEWRFLGDNLYLPEGSNIYIRKYQYKRFVNSLRWKLAGVEIRTMEDHPTLKQS